MRNIYVYEGDDYEIVERLAHDGDKVLTFGRHSSGITPGKVYEITRVNFIKGETKTNHLACFTDDDGDSHRAFWNGKGYYVLEPLDKQEECAECCVDTTQASPAVIDMLANLARRLTAAEGRVTQLESQLRATQRNVETWAEQTESNSEDIRTLDARTQDEAIAEVLARRLNREARY